MKRIQSFSVLVFLLIGIMLSSCETDSKPQSIEKEEKKRVTIPSFNQNDAYKYIEKQVSFGPRMPNTEGHKACRDWLMETFESMNTKVYAQDFEATAYTGEVLNGTNIIASYNPKHKRRIIVAAHWDTRHIADQDEDLDRRNEPIMGADDGGSGVGVILEMASILNENPIDIGVDFILFDLEDYGNNTANAHDTYCLGSQYWSRNPHIRNYKAEFGILLDMVGGKNPKFGYEFYSYKYARSYMEKIWRLAKGMGYGSMFTTEEIGGITDDHKYVNEIAKIPMLDIISKPGNTQYGFVPHWHTHDDTMEAIDPKTLKGVGQVVIASLYNYSVGRL